MPTIHHDPNYLQLFQQSAVVEKLEAADSSHPERTDAVAGSVFGNVIAAFIVIATGATVHAAGAAGIEAAYSVTEAFGFRKGVNLDFRQAPIFFCLVSAAVLVLLASQILGMFGRTQ